MYQEFKAKIQNQRKKVWYYETKRIWFLLLLIVVFLIPSSNYSVVLFALSVTTLTMVVSHITRKLLFPYFDMGVYMRKALEHPIGAAIIVAAVFFLIVTLINATVVLLK